MNLGYDKAIYLLPFDHRQSYVKDMFHLEPPLTVPQRDQVIDREAGIGIDDWGGGAHRGAIRMAPSMRTDSPFM